MTTPPDGPTAPTPVRGVLDVDRPGPRISKHVYGHFAEHLGRCIYDGIFVGEDSPVPHVGGIRLDVVEALRALAVPNLRWPGGCFGDEYHWRDGIGPRSSRPAVVNTNWGDVVEDNSFGTHEFMALCELLGADPYVSANVGSGTVREASEWIEYLTRADDSPMARLRRQNGRDEPWRVPFWGLGNEPWGCGGRFSPEAYAQQARTFGSFSREHAGNTLYRIAAGASSDDYRWTETLMKSLGFTIGSGEQKGEGPGTYQAISFHHYTVPGTWEAKGSATDFSETEYWRTIAEATRIETILAGHAAIMDAYDPRRTIGLVLDEWGTWFDVEPGTNPGFLHQQSTVRDALVAGIHFDAFHRHADRLAMANIAQVVNVLQAVILTDGAGLVLTPTYHVFEMNKGHQDASSLALTFDSLPGTIIDGLREVPTLSASASRTDHAVLISLTNLDLHESVAVEIDLRGADVGSPVARVLTGDLPGSHNTATDPVRVRPAPLDGVAVTAGVVRLTLPRHSFATVELPIVSG